MTKTSSSNLQETQSPPLITDHDGDDKIKGVNSGVHHKVDEKGVEDHDEDEGNKNNTSMCIIDVRNEEDKEKVCRICQLSSDHLPAGTGNLNLVLLGCACRGELGISHYNCALLWFQLKGNRTCEICGKAAKNIAGIEDTGFRAYGTDIGIITSAEITRMRTYETQEHQCTKSLCNFILAAIVLAFLLPWALHSSKLL
ncbi:unnamed protein product [Amaranthus hypochondriacus]